MQSALLDPTPIIFTLGLFTLVPIFFVLTTSFIKISTVCILTRESLGVQQIPPNMVIYGLSIILSVYIMAPIYNKSYQAVTMQVKNDEPLSAPALLRSFQASSEPLRTFLVKHTPPTEREFFYRTLQEHWPKDLLQGVTRTDFMVIVPSFVISEITQAFKVGFLIYLPSMIIDIIISNILLAMGMMMMSPVTISLPLKLLLFISLDGWSRLIHALLNTY